MVDQRLCQIGQGRPCGREATHMIAVTNVADTAWAEESRDGGIVFLCDLHATSQPSEWGNW